MSNPAILAAAGIVAMLVSFEAGKYAQPARVEYRDKIVEKTVEVAAKEKESASVQASQTDVKTVTRWRIHVVEKPSGEVVTTASSDSGEERKAQSHHEETKREAQVVYKDRLVDHEVTKLVEARRPDWSIEARAGLIDSGHGPLVYGGAVGRRLIGGLSAVVYASTAREIGLGVRFEF